MKKLNGYVGRIVRLNNETFRRITQRSQRRGVSVDNCFVVADVDREMRKLICYGTHLRVAVAKHEVALI